jgi:predicted DNA-binding transcriptional regulator AlpA
MGAQALRGDRPPAFLSRASLAAELDMSESTVDEMVRRGVLPRPRKLSTGCVRWSWSEVAVALASLGGGDMDAADPFIRGAQDAARTATERRRGAA